MKHYKEQQQGGKNQPHIPPCTEMKTIDVHSSELSGGESKNTFNEHIQFNSPTSIPQY